MKPPQKNSHDFKAKYAMTMTGGILTYRRDLNNCGELMANIRGRRDTEHCGTRTDRTVCIVYRCRTQART